MKLVKANLKELKFTIYSKTNNLDILEEFIDSNMECAEVTGHNCARASHKTGSLNQSIKRYRVGGIRAVTVKNRCYLIKVPKEIIK